MSIINFTPVTATLGGILIGLAVVVFFLFNGRLVGISGIAANALTNKSNRFDMGSTQTSVGMHTLFFYSP